VAIRLRHGFFPGGQPGAEDAPPASPHLPSSASPCRRATPKGHSKGPDLIHCRIRPYMNQERCRCVPPLARPPPGSALGAPARHGRATTAAQQPPISNCSPAAPGQVRQIVFLAWLVDVAAVGKSALWPAWCAEPLINSRHEPHPPPARPSRRGCRECSRCWGGRGPGLARGRAAGQRTGRGPRPHPRLPSPVGEAPRRCNSCPDSAIAAHRLGQVI
jgi:hypothetical protein